MVALDAPAVTTALSAMCLDLGASIEALEWTVSRWGSSAPGAFASGSAASFFLYASMYGVLFVEQLQAWGCRCGESWHMQMPRFQVSNARPEQPCDEPSLER
jgi:hypothetical protein